MSSLCDGGAGLPPLYFPLLNFIPVLLQCFHQSFSASPGNVPSFPVAIVSIRSLSSIPPSLPPSLQDESDDFHYNGSSSTDPSSSTSSFSSSSLPPPATSDFGAAAATVAKEFTSILRLVHRLQRLVTRKGMHNDPTAEIEDVTAVFKKDLGRLQGDIESLLRYAEKHYR